MIKILPLLVALIAQLLIVVPSVHAFLQDDLNPGEMPGRVVVGGEFIPAPDGSGWLSGMRLGLAETFYGRRDYVLYYDLQPGKDLPLAEGTLELWLQRQRPRSNELDRDTLWQFLDNAGRTLITVAVVYPDGPLPPQLIVAETADVWGENLPIPPVAVGESYHLAFVWGATGEADNHIYFNGQEILPQGGVRSGNLASVLSKSVAMKLGTGYSDEDPAYHTCFDQLRFQGEKATFP